MLLKIFFTILIMIECFLSMKIPIYFSKKVFTIKSKIFNVENFENLASGVILSLSIIHLMPEAVILAQTETINIYLIFIIIILSISFLNISDMLFEQCIQDNENENENETINTNNLSINKICTSEHIDTFDTTSKIGQINENFNSNTEIERNINDKKNNDFLNDLCKTNSLFIILSLFIHSLLEGILLGGLNDSSGIIIMALSLIFHKWAEGLIIYENVLKKISNKTLNCIYSGSFILALPIGVIVTTFYFPKSNFIELIFNSIASGFFIYLSFNMTKNIKITKINKYYMAISYLIGLITMGSIMLTFTYFENINNINIF